MGKHNSRDTRVIPIFDQLISRDPTGASWLPALLALPGRDGSPTSRPVTPAIVGDVRYGKHEASLAPPRSLLRHLVEHPELLTPPASLGKSPDTRARRAALLSNTARRVRVQADALALLATKASPRGKWYALEGATHPDVYVATPDAIIVIEGKRTERGTTTKTSWLATRDQMLRHIDSAWELRGDRRVYGFLIVEALSGHEVPDGWRRDAARIVESPMLRASLPHRNAAERRAIADAFLGATTWQRLCQACGLQGRFGRMAQ